MPRRDNRRSLKGGSIVAVAAVLATLAMLAGVAEAAQKRKRIPLPPMGPSLRSNVSFATVERPGTIVIRKDERLLYYVAGDGRAVRYKISVGREGFSWTGVAKVGAKQEWPQWRPPSEMRSRQPDLPEFVPAGPYNPLGARALYLFMNGRDTLFRIHGTNDPGGVGFDGTSGCFRLTNTDVIDLYERVSLGSKVIVQ